MSLRKFPEIKADAGSASMSWDVPSDALSRWVDMPQAAASTSENTISIYDVIGADRWTGGGFTAKRMDAALRAIGNNPVTVLINSPGGDLMEGITIFNLLARHPAEVTVSVVGMAASSASVIAMAGDKIEMGAGSVMFVHRAWGMVIGNRNDLADAVQVFERFDAGIADIYEARTGAARADILAMMDAETFMNADEAIAAGFADRKTNISGTATAKAEQKPVITARRKLDALLAQTGLPRSERRHLLREAAGGMPDAASAVTQDAGYDHAAMRQLIDAIKS